MCVERVQKECKISAKVFQKLKKPKYIIIYIYIWSPDKDIKNILTFLLKRHIHNHNAK